MTTTETFTYAFSKGRKDYSWLIKPVESLEELAEVAHMRYIIYSKQGYVNMKEIRSRSAYRTLMELLREEDLDRHEGLYEVDDYDRIPSIIGYHPIIPFTKIAMGLKEGESGPLSIDGKNYTLVATERFVVDDKNIVENGLGLPMEPDYDINWFRKKLENNRRIMGETGRLMRGHGVHPFIITGMHRLIVNFAMDYEGDRPVPDNVITSRPKQQSYYENIGFSAIGEPFHYSKLGGELWVPMHFDMEATRRLIADADENPSAEAALLERYPRPDEQRYLFKPINGED